VDTLGAIYAFIGVVICIGIPIGLIALLIRYSSNKKDDLRKTVEQLSNDMLTLKRETQRLVEIVGASDSGFKSRSVIQNPESSVVPSINLVVVHRGGARKPRLNPRPARAVAFPTTRQAGSPVTAVRPTFPLAPSSTPEPKPQPVPLAGSQPPPATPPRAIPPLSAANLPTPTAPPGPTQPVPEAVRPPVQPLPTAERPAPPAIKQPARPAMAPAATYTLTRAEWESLIGGKLLNWIGALATIIGIGFFLRYAFQNNWITPTMRVAIGFFIGGGLLVGGNISYAKSFKIFSQGLIGAGISILYLSVYAAFNFYHLAPQRTAFVMMSAVTVVTFVQALRFNSLAISILGWLGGFLTPFLLSTGVSNETGLFSYIAILIAGLLAMAAFKEGWIVLQPLTLAATYVIYALWYSKYYAPTALLETSIFLSIFWLLFLILDVYWAVRGSNKFLEVREVFGAFNAVFYYTALYVILDSVRHDLTGITTLAVGVIYFVVAVGIERIKWNGAQFNRYLLSAIAFLVLATAFQFTGFTTVTLWSAEAAVLIWSARRWKLRAVTIASVLLYAAAFIKLFATGGWAHYGPPEQFRLLLNPRALAFATLAAASAAGAIALRPLKDEKPTALSAALNYMWCLLGFILITVEINDEFARLITGTNGDWNSTKALHFENLLTMVMMWMLCSLPLVWYGIQKRISSLTVSGLAMLGISALTLSLAGAQYEPLSRYFPILNLRVAVFAALLIALFVQANWLSMKAQEYKWAAVARLGVLLVWCALLLVLCTGEVRDYFRWLIWRADAEQEAALRFKASMALVIVWMGYSGALFAVAIKKKIKPIVFSAAAVTCCAIITVLVSGFEYTPLQNFVPLINSRVLSLGTVIAGLLLMSRFIRDGAGQWQRKVLTAVAIAVALLIVYLLSVETKDYFGRQMLLLAQPGFGPVTDQLSEQTLAALGGLSNLQQMALSVVWVGYSILLIAFGIWRRMLSLRMVAIALVGIAILKIFFYDLSFLQTGYRIISFIALGLILLAISFLYQRFKSVIYESGADHDTGGPQSA